MRNVGKFDTKNRSCLFKMKVRSYTNFNVPKSLVMFICCALDWKCIFLADLARKLRTYLNMLNSMVIFNFSLPDRKYLFWQIWFKKTKLPNYDETWCLDVFKYTELNGNADLPCFELDIHLLGKFVPNFQNFLFFNKIKGCKKSWFKVNII